VSIVFPNPKVNFSNKIKSPPASVPAGFGFFDLSGRLVLQAMAVRRHGFSMMVVVTVMAAALHLSKK
jgi:hypothetical protein